MAWADHESAAQDAFTAAFPALNTSDPRCQCFGPTLRWDVDGEGTGKVCLDGHGRATMAFENVPKAAIGKAMTETWGADWFDEGPGGLAAAEPGRYHYEDEQTYAEYEFDVKADGTVDLDIAYVKVDDIVAMLDALERALAELRCAA
ncbi:hypothetical protein EV284_6421 [Streptomyces sp. BK022]|uniref:hypothetical protein n=1 Tax=Streptomyces sp. BK022 TaxID=2512123 RepID=UPI001028F7FE|nr:hypothetical protein [Streptomyces sp. BK022]RZU28255.1 hypothetical protein EV284_6421 [Streptomyces sp. BK022]